MPLPLSIFLPRAEPRPISISTRSPHFTEDETSSSTVKEFPPTLIPTSVLPYNTRSSIAAGEMVIDTEIVVLPADATDISAFPPHCDP